MGRPTRPALPRTDRAGVPFGVSRPLVCGTKDVTFGRGPSPGAEYRGGEEGRLALFLGWSKVRALPSILPAAPALYRKHRWRCVIGKSLAASPE